MYAAQVKALVWRAARKMDPKPALYQPRVSSTSGQVGQSDTYQSYNLQRVTYRPPSTDELDIIQASLGDRIAVFNIYQRDLELSGRDGTPSVVTAPIPQVSYLLTVVDNAGDLNTWTIESVSNDDLQTVYTCICRITH